MSFDHAIRLSGVSKKYHIYKQPLDRLKQIIFPSGRHYTEFEALRDITLDIGKGETFGIVGRNGSGKSTLLQIIAGTLSASEGEVDVKGRVAALLELGTGFNPNFTGRENVFINAAILGLGQAEIRDKFDDIAAFADIGDFLDRPLKTYSSGMHTRLGFAVAIHTDPDILIVDEALAVGDEAFQRKCYARIQSLKKQGTTILFVSHSAGIVMELCDRALLLDQGECLAVGEPRTVTSAYQRLSFAAEGKRAEIRALILAGELASKPTADEGDESLELEGDGKLIDMNLPMMHFADSQTPEFIEGLTSQSRVPYPPAGGEINNVKILDDSGAQINLLATGAPFSVAYRARFDAEFEDVHFVSHIKTVTGLQLGGQMSTEPDGSGIPVKGGQSFEVALPMIALLNEGSYFLNVGVFGTAPNGEVVLIHRIVDAAILKIGHRSHPRGFGHVSFVAGSQPTIRRVA